MCVRLHADVQSHANPASLLDNQSHPHEGCTCRGTVASNKSRTVIMYVEVVGLPFACKGSRLASQPPRAQHSKRSTRMSAGCPHADVSDPFARSHVCVLCVRLWSRLCRQLVRNAHEPTTEVCSLSFSQDDRTLLSRGMDGTMKVWDLRK